MNFLLTRCAGCSKKRNGSLVRFLGFRALSSGHVELASTYGPHFWVPRSVSVCWYAWLEIETMGRSTIMKELAHISFPNLLELNLSTIFAKKAKTDSWRLKAYNAWRVPNWRGWILVLTSLQGFPHWGSQTFLSWSRSPCVKVQAK